jgi:hypothetical protein
MNLHTIIDICIGIIPVLYMAAMDKPHANCSVQHCTCFMFTTTVCANWKYIAQTKLQNILEIGKISMGFKKKIWWKISPTKS